MPVPLFSCQLWSTVWQEEERENEWEWIIELTPSSGKHFIGFVSLWCWLSPWGRADHWVNVWVREGIQVSLWLLYRVCNLLLTISSVPWSRGPAPGARSEVHPGRSDRTFYLLASSLNSSMTQPGLRHKKFAWPWLKQQTLGDLRVRWLATLASLTTWQLGKILVEQIYTLDAMDAMVLF